MGHQSLKRILTTAVVVLVVIGAVAVASALRHEPAAGKVVVVSSRPVEHTVSIVGSTAPARVVAVVAPYDGTILESNLQFGGVVNQGDMLFVLSTDQLDRDLDDARVVLSRTEGTARAKLDIKRAQSAVQTADLALDTLDRRIKETKELVDEGIVARDEWSNLVEQRLNTLQQAKSAQQELDALLDPGTGAANALELRKLRAQVENMERLRSQSSIRAPISGIVLRPASQTNAATEILAGIKVTRGMLVALVGDVSNFQVIVPVDEIDINALHPGQPVTVTCAGAGSAGSIKAISGQAQPSPSSGLMTFDTFIAAPDLSPECKLGMSATVDIVTYKNDHALLVPPEAIFQDGNGSFVRVNGDRRAVEVGRSFPEGVEVRSDLKPGDAVQLP